VIVFRWIVAVLPACQLAGQTEPGAQVQVRPQVAGRPMRDGQVTTVYLAPRYVTGLPRASAISTPLARCPDFSPSIPVSLGSPLPFGLASPPDHCVPSYLPPKSSPSQTARCPLVPALSVRRRRIVAPNSLQLRRLAVPHTPWNRFNSLPPAPKRQYGFKVFITGASRTSEPNGRLRF
jgi:hypothetical protein